MIQFPAEAEEEWKAIADAAETALRLRRKISHDLSVETETEKVRVRHEAKLIHQQELDADQTPVLEMMTLANYQLNPAAAPADLIDGVVKQDGLCIVLGPNSSGKSTIALQMLHSMMTGEDFLGQTAKPIMGAVGIASYDMDAALMMDWMSGFPNVDPTKVSVVNAHKRGNPLGVAAMRSKIAQVWRSLNVEIVLIDSFSATFFAQDQNDAAATMHHYRDLKLFALTEVGAKALIVIAHASPDSPNKARGSTVHHDVADSIMSVSIMSPGGKDDPREIRMIKYRAARGQHQMNPVCVGAPDNVTHLVELDTGAMALAGHALPQGYKASVAFKNEDLPQAHDDPQTDETDSEEDWGDDL